MSIIQRWKSPSPLFFKRIFRVSLIIAGGAGTLLAAPSLVSAMPGGFTFVLYPWTAWVCKNLVVAGLVSATLSKLTKETSVTETLTIKKETTVEEPPAP